MMAKGGQNIKKSAIGQRVVAILPYIKKEIPIMIVFRYVKSYFRFRFCFKSISRDKTSALDLVGDCFLNLTIFSPINFDFYVCKMCRNRNRLDKKTENVPTKNVRKKIRQIEEAIAS